MNADEILDEMKQVAEKLHVKVRHEFMPVLGGLCTIKGTQIIFLNTALDLWDQVDVMARALAQLPIEKIFMAPQVRQMIEQYKNLSQKGDAAGT